MKNLSLSFLLLFLYFNASGTSVQGTLQDMDGSPLHFANVLLYDSDSTLVKLEYTAEDGSFNFQQVSAGDYWIQISYIGYDDLIIPTFQLIDGENKELSVITLNQSSTSLDQITVTAKKPLLELKPDKVVMNVEGSITNSGSDAFTLLRKAPGVMIDNGDNIFLSGKGGVQIYIDDKISPLQGSDLLEYLRSIPSSEIESIEIITNPSSKYDAQGNAGIINIRMRRDKNLGTQGNVSASTRHGIRSNYNTTVRLTNRSKHYNTFGSVSLYDGGGIDDMSLYREQNGLVFDQNGDGGGDWRGVNYRLGQDWYLGEQHTFGLLFNGSLGDSQWNNESRTELSTIGHNFIDSILVAESRNMSDRHNENLNLNYAFKSKSGLKLNVDLDYGNYNRDAAEEQPNTYFASNEKDVLSAIEFATETPNNIKIITAKWDLEKAIGKGSFSAGMKYSKVITDNTFNFYEVEDGQRELDIERSNQFTYDENVNAAYASYATQMGAFSLQTGLRLEHTNSKGELMAMVPTDNETVERDYLDFFPSMGLSFQLDDKNAFQFNYSRRLNRPSYSDLNPFRMRLDELTFNQGNPFLNPEYASNFQVSHSWNYKLTTSLSYSHTSDKIARITDAEGEKFAFITWKNIADQHSWSLNMAAPIPIKEWWSSYTSVTGLYTRNSADFGEGKVIDLDQYSFNVYSQHNFSLPGKYNLEVSGWYNTPSIWEGNFRMDAMYSLDLGIQKSFLDDKLSVKVAVSDIFRSQVWNGETRLGSQYILASGANDTRQLRVNMSYSFGNSNVKARKRRTGLEDEQRRIKGGN